METSLSLILKKTMRQKEGRTKNRMTSRPKIIATKCLWAIKKISEKQSVKKK